MSSKIMKYFTCSSVSKKLKPLNGSCASKQSETVTLFVGNKGKSENLNIEPTCENTVNQAHDNKLGDLPECCTLDQKSEFCERNEWLIVSYKTFGCTICKEVGNVGIERNKQGMNVAQPWTTVVMN